MCSVEELEPTGIENSMGHFGVEAMVGSGVVDGST
jgi:hypothetical protein